MIAHYLKVAVRNLLKYKTQSVISIVGLAVGFVCFALANIWTRYEMTYDAHLDGSERMYVLYKHSVLSQYGYSTMSSYPMSTTLKESFPEVEASCAFNYWGKSDVETEDGTKYSARAMLADSCFMKMFDIRIAEGTNDFLYSNELMAVTSDFAQRVYGTTDVFGKKMTDVDDKTFTICAVLEGTSPHSNFSFDYWILGEYFRKFYDDWSNVGYTTIVKLHKGIEVNDFLDKMRNIESDKKQSFEGYYLYPLSKYHYAEFNGEKSIQFNYLILFSTIGILVILSSLFNYLSLFVVRIRTRLREIGLRKVYGATIGNMTVMFLMEYVPIILLSGLFGMMAIELIFPTFCKVSLVTGGMYAESLLYFAAVTLISVLILLPVLAFSQKLSSKVTNNRFRKASIVCQLIISIFFLFCVSVIIKQVYFLKNTDLGWERKDIATFSPLREHIAEVASEIKQFPSVKEMITGYDTGLLPKNMRSSIFITDWEGKSSDAPNINIEFMQGGKEYFDFYNLRIVDGQPWWNAPKPKALSLDVIINESCAKALGYHDPVGKGFYGYNREPFFHIIGVVKDFHTAAPTVPVQPLMFAWDNGIERDPSDGCIIIKYHHGKWKELKADVDKLFASKFPETPYRFVNVEDVYAQFLKSEDLLLKTLSIITVVCMFISALGIFSLVSFTCRQRQKEIAIRKINGATIRDILSIFIKEYTLMSFVSAVIAFTAGYAVMKRWIENYTVQTSISIWLFVGIYVIVVLIIALCIGYRVWKAANENPADVVKSE